MNRRREPVFNFSEPAPVRFAGLLIGFYALIAYTPLGMVRNSGELLVLRPLAVTDGLGWFATLGYSLAHAGWGHVLMNSVMLIIFAIITMRGARAKGIRAGVTPRPERAFMLVFLAGVLGGALAQWAWWAVTGTLDASAVGASGGVSALFASAGYAIGGRDQMVRYGLAWAAINALLVVFPMMGNIAWAAHLGGFAGGMLVASRLVSPGSTTFGVT